MYTKGYSTEGIVLSRKNYGEADRLLVVYSRHFGQLRLLAKGIRKPKSRKRGHLEVFAHIKFSAATGKGMDIVTEVETIDSFDEIRSDLKRVSVAYYLCEILSKLTRDGEKNESVFSSAINLLQSIRISDRLRSLRKQFVVDVLISLGFWSNGRVLSDPDKMVEGVTERRVNSIRVGRAMLV